MLQARIWPAVGLSILAPLSVQPAWSDPVSDGLARLPVYLCQLGGTAHAFAFSQTPDGAWQGLGQLQGWRVMVQAGGLVARNADDVLIIADGAASLVRQGQLVQGQCTEDGGDLSQPIGGEGLAPRGEAGVAEAGRPGDPAADLTVRDEGAAAGGAKADSTMSDPWLDGVLSLLDPAAWDPAKVAALVDALTLDDPAKLGLKAELRAAGRDPARTAVLARQIQRAFGLELAAAAEMRARLQDARRDLAAMTRAFEDERLRAEETARLLADANARANAAERANNQTAALLGAAERALRDKNADLARWTRDAAALRQQVAGLQQHLGALEAALRQKDAELARTARDAAALRQQVAALQEQQRLLQAALDAAMAEQQTAAIEIATLNQQLVETRARLARANKKIDELRGVRN